MQCEICGSVGVLGFGVDGRAVASWLCASDNVKEVLVFDDNHYDEFPSAEFRASSNSKVRKFESSDSLKDLSVLFRSPGFSLTHPLVKKAKECGVSITSSTIEVLTHFSGTTIGVTGSNGKTTCVALIQEFLKAAFGNDRVKRGGNDGMPRLDLLNKDGMEDTFLVLELSSFQLIDLPVSPDVSVVLNVTPNHLNWHADMEEYAEAKRRIVAHQTSEGHAILNPDDPIVRGFAEGIKSQVHWFVCLDSARHDTNINILCKTHPSTIRAAVTAAHTLNVSEDVISEVLRTFPGVPHRLEFIREIDGIRYYNDSSCTTPESVITACELFPENSLIILMGGRDKNMDFSRLYDVIRDRNVRIVPYGEMGETFRKNISNELCIDVSDPSDFGDVIDVARLASSSGDNIVLSPACASFDMFKNAKERGERFSGIVLEMV